MEEKSDYIVVHSWMINCLNLNGIPLLTYALIYGFSRDGKFFKGTYEYIKKMTGAKSNSTVSLVLQSLESLGYIKKEDGEHSAKKTKLYKCVPLTDFYCLKIEQTLFENRTKNSSKIEQELFENRTNKSLKIEQNSSKIEQELFENRTTQKDNIDNLLKSMCDNISVRAHEDTPSQFKQINFWGTKIEDFQKKYPNLDMSNYSFARLEDVDWDKLDKALEESSWLTNASFGFLLNNYDRVIEGEFKDLKRKGKESEKKFSNQREYSEEYFNSLIKSKEDL